LFLKVENKNWEREKTLNEVTNLEYINRHTSIPVPKVLAYESAISDSLIDQEYILMAQMKGTPLNLVFDRVYSNPNHYVYVLEQLADILAELKKHPFSKIGCLNNLDAFTLKNPIDFGNSSDKTPCNSFSEYAQRWLSYYLTEMKNLKNAGHQNSEYFERFYPSKSKN